MSRYDDQGVWHPPMEPGRLEYEAELLTNRNPAPHAEPPLVGTPSRTLQVGCGTVVFQCLADLQPETAPPTCVNSGIGRCINSVPCVNGKCKLDNPAAVLKGYYDFVNECPRVRVELTPEGRDLCAGTKLWPHPMPPQPKPLPKLPPVPKDMCLASAMVGDKRVELRGWTTEMMQPWIDAVLAAFKESGR